MAMLTVRGYWGQTPISQRRHASHPQGQPFGWANLGSDPKNQAAGSVNLGSDPKNSAQVPVINPWVT